MGQKQCQTIRSSISFLQYGAVYIVYVEQPQKINQTVRGQSINSALLNTELCKKSRGTSLIFNDLSFLLCRINNSDLLGHENLHQNVSHSILDLFNTWPSIKYHWGGRNSQRTSPLLPMTYDRVALPRVPSVFTYNYDNTRGLFSRTAHTIIISNG